ncbi:MAG: alpha-L-rhamnosidase N-terminal domain-containing protein, partial [Cyclobacteriaceae bacterium]|nr:alpha-L-rhamnosidase N-terminal domain-containing protein [Cyclobacteriaceae bacterium]
MKQNFIFILLLSAMVVFLSACNQGAENRADQPIAVKCEYQTNPMGLDVKQPRFSWMVNDQSRGAVQTAYQILVASNLDILARDEGDVWDSGMVDSDQSQLVTFDGAPLESKTRYFWKVRTWNREGNPSEYSQPAWWEMGLLSPGDWQAEWIGKDEVGRPPRSVMLRKEFAVEGGINKARLYITGLGNYIAYINGKRVGNDMLTPGWTDYPTKVQYQTYDVTSMLKEGENVIGAVLGNMWWSSGLGWQGGATYSDGPLRLLAQLEIDSGEENLMIVTDDSWSLSHSPYLENTIYHGVTYDAQMEQPGWNEAGFNEGSWEKATLINDEGRKLVAQQGPPIRVTERREPVAIREVKPGIQLFD